MTQHMSLIIGSLYGILFLFFGASIYLGTAYMRNGHGDVPLAKRIAFPLLTWATLGWPSVSVIYSFGLKGMVAILGAILLVIIGIFLAYTIIQMLPKHVDTSIFWYGKGQ